MSNIMRLFLFQLFLLLLFFAILKVQNTIRFGKDAAADDLEITIGQGNVIDSSVALTYSGDGDAYQNKKVKWVIAGNSNVEKIFITQKENSTQIFKWFDTPHGVFYKKTVVGTVKNDAIPGSEYIYAIHWKDKTGKEYVFDPKIAVRAGLLKDLDLVVYALYFVSVVVSFLFRKRFLYK